MQFLRILPKKSPNEGIYNLQGMRINLPVHALPAGFYIINGEKVLIRP